MAASDRKRDKTVGTNKILSSLESIDARLDSQDELLQELFDQVSVLIQILRPDPVELRDEDDVDR